MLKLVGGALTVVALSLLQMPIASADPIGDSADDIYGLVTPNESQEIWSGGQRNCIALDQAYESSPPVNSDDVIEVIEGYRAEGWDLESSSDIVWESVEGRCPEYLDAVKRAVRSYGDPS